MGAYYKINSENITYRIIDNQAVILNLNTGDYYSLNETGTFIWGLIEKGITREDLIDRVLEEYAIDKKDVIRDIKLLLKDLISEKIVKQEEFARHNNIKTTIDD
jgi:hypothetical protein